MSGHRNPGLEHQIPQSVFDVLDGQYRVRKISKVNPGASGAHVFRCDTKQQDVFALRRYPKGTPQSRVKEIQGVMQSACASGCELVPRLHRLGSNTPAHYDGTFIWELSTWRPGNPLKANASSDQIACGAEAIGQFHSAIVGLAATTESCPAVSARIKRIRQLNEELPSVLSQAMKVSHAEAPSLSESLNVAARFLQVSWKEFEYSAMRQLTRFQPIRVPVHYALRDVHREHILFSSGACGERVVTGLIDFDAVRIDSPATDLARWLSSFTQFWSSPDETWGAVVAGYCRGSALDNRGQKSKSYDLMRDLVTLLADTGIMIGLANWLVWIIAEKRRFPNNSAVSERISQLMGFAKMLRIGGGSLDLEH